VRNALLGMPIGDIDIATTLKPQTVMRLAQVAGFHTVPTGIDFGTVTVIINHRPFEVTSLRRDVRSDGRRAIVAFGEDWHEDAKRRDFTINALYCDAAGIIYDEVGGLEDVMARRIRFIGAAEMRIREDYLRILRFFRFFAYYGDGRPDGQALKAIVRQRQGLLKLSSERIWGELKKILGATNPHRTLLWMRQSGVLSLILPESEKWGIDLVPGLIQAECLGAFVPDPLLRLMSMIPPDETAIKILARRLKLANFEKKRLIDWATTPSIAADMEEGELNKILYKKNVGSIIDKVKLALASHALKRVPLFDAYQNLLTKIENWQRPCLPLNGRDLIDHGVESGAVLGEILTKLEADWIASDFRLTKTDLLAKLS